MSTPGRNAYDTATSGEVQTDIASVVARLETAIATRQSDVNAAMADFQADGVSEEYRAVEQRWNNAAEQVRQIIALVQTTLQRNDESATTALTRASSAVQGIG
jgi:hypothetical protein